MVNRVVVVQGCPATRADHHLQHTQSTHTNVVCWDAGRLRPGWEPGGTVRGSTGGRAYWLFLDGKERWVIGLDMYAQNHDQFGSALCRKERRMMRDAGGYSIFPCHRRILDLRTADPMRSANIVDSGPAFGSERPCSADRHGAVPRPPREHSRTTRYVVQ